MGKSFRENWDIYDQREKLLARRKEREEKLMRRLWSIHEWRIRVDNDKEAKKITSDWIRKLHSSSIRSILFMETFLTLDEDMAEAMARGTLYEEFPPDTLDDSEHPIFTHASQEFMNRVLMPNPELSQVYFAPPEDAPLLLRYDPDAWKTRRLNEEQIEAIRTKAKAYTQSLLPPEGILQVMHQSLDISTWIRVRVWVLQSRIELIVNIALARGRNKKSPRKNV